ncbi:MAG: sigma-70 family RNA polymerase sigma factor [Wenzhouxiangella sp.]|nr:sigma-70 family RNA polymerase sigma factor [Wenzhouxiangella sp.]
MDEKDRSGEPSVRELADRIGRGDPAAEEALVRRYGRPLEFMLRQKVREASLAADLAQDALLILIERLRGPGLDDPDKLVAFLHQTASNLARGEARTYYRRNTHPDQGALALAAVNAPLLEDQVAREQLGAIIRQLLEELGQARDRELLKRFYLGGDSKEQLCADFQISPAHFDRIHFRARQRFRQIVESKASQFLPNR